MVGTLLGYNARDRLTLVLAFQGVVGRLLRTIGIVIEEALAEEANRPHWNREEDDSANLMQTTLVTTDRDWSEFLLDLRASLESLGSGNRRANSKILRKWLDYRCTDSQSGKCLGHMHGRVGQLLAVLVAAMESTCEGDCYLEHDETWCSVWYKRISLFLPTHPGSNKARNLPMPQGDPMPVLFMRPLPDESDSDVVPEISHSLRTHRANSRDLDGLIEEERLDRQEEAQLHMVAEQAEQVAMEEEAEETSRLADQWLEDEGRLAELSASEYQAWEDRQLRREMQAPPTRKRTFLQLEVASGSGDMPRTAHTLWVPLQQAGATVQITASLVHREELVNTQPATAGDTLRDRSPGATSVQGGDVLPASEAETVLVPPAEEKGLPMVP